MRTIMRQLNGPLDLDAVISTAKTIPFRSPKGKELKWWVTFSLEQPRRTVESSNQAHTVIRAVDRAITGGDGFKDLKAQMKEMFGPREERKIYTKDSSGRLTYRMIEAPKSTKDYSELEMTLFIQNVRAFGKDWGGGIDI